MLQLLCGSFLWLLCSCSLSDVLCLFLTTKSRVWTTCLRLLLESGTARDRTHKLSVAGPTPYHYTPRPKQLSRKYRWMAIEMEVVLSNDTLLCVKRLDFVCLAAWLVVFLCFTLLFWYSCVRCCAHVFVTSMHYECFSLFITSSWLLMPPASSSERLCTIRRPSVPSIDSSSDVVQLVCHSSVAGGRYWSMSAASGQRQCCDPRMIDAGFFLSLWCAMVYILLNSLQMRIKYVILFLNWLKLSNFCSNSILRFLLEYSTSLELSYHMIGWNQYISLLSIHTYYMELKFMQIRISYLDKLMKLNNKILRIIQNQPFCSRVDVYTPSLTCCLWILCILSSYLSWCSNVCFIIS